MHTGGRKSVSGIWEADYAGFGGFGVWEFRASRNQEMVNASL